MVIVMKSFLEADRVARDLSAVDSERIACPGCRTMLSVSLAEGLTSIFSCPRCRKRIVAEVESSPKDSASVHGIMAAV
jgi:uncharacterized protein YbaR (Trm112 family)